MCIGRTSMFTIVEIPVLTCQQVVTEMMTEQCCKNIVIMG